MPTNTLTDAKCKSAKAAERPIKMFDGGGLHLYVSTTGAKTWRMAYRLAGKPQTISFGPYPAVTLADARAKRDAAKDQLREGADPMAPRRVTRAGLKFREACQQYWDGRQDVTTGYRANAIRALELHLWPALGDRVIGSITRDDLMVELLAMNAAGLFVYVRKTRMWSSQVFEWAIERGDCKVNPAASIRPERAFGSRPIEHFASVGQREVGALLQRLAMEQEIQSVLACRFLAYTWVRTTEMRMMSAGEIEGSLWRIPGERMKRRREHLVPLPRQAVAILKKMQQRSRGSVYVWPSDHRIDRPMSENSVLYLLHRIGYKDRMTGHGWRSVASTWANERGYTPDAIERQLAHAPDDKVRASYNNAAFMAERTAMLQAWADWLDEVEAGSTQG